MYRRLHQSLQDSFLVVLETAELLQLRITHLQTGLAVQADFVVIDPGNFIAMLRIVIVTHQQQ